jgi:hypothetical protein
MPKGKFPKAVTLRIIWHNFLRAIWHIRCHFISNQSPGFQVRFDRPILPFQFVDLEDSPYVSMSDQGERQSTTLFTTTALRRQLLEATADCYSKQWDLKAAGRRRSGLFTV